MKYTAAKATTNGPFHAVNTALGLTPGLSYSALCGVTVSGLWAAWSRVAGRKCPKCARIAELMKKELAELEKEP